MIYERFHPEPPMRGSKGKSFYGLMVPSRTLPPSESAKKDTQKTKNIFYIPVVSSGTNQGGSTKNLSLYSKGHSLIKNTDREPF